jgi:phosphatidylserine/phosphatidylglycerophosphate/cardiolipin synthase-like enzyme
VSVALGGGEAQRLVRCAYGALDLFAGRREELLAWSGTLSAGRPASALAPDWWARVTADALVGYLTDAAVAGADGSVDPYRLAQLQQVIELLPHFQDAELVRRPAPQPKVVFTLPPGVKLPERAKDLARRTLAVRILTALGSSDERTLLASPYWSDQGAENLWDGLLRSVALDLPITLAGAKADPERDDLQAMLRLASRLRAEGASEVRALRYVPPAAKAWGLFHGKLVGGRVGYLGSANLTGSGLGEHVEAGIALEPVDVERVWWLLDVLADAGLLVPEHF